MITENTQNPVNVAAKAPRTTKKAWDFPISKAYYEKVRVRGEKIMDELGYGAEWMKYLMPHIDRYLLKGERLGNHYAYECMLIVFTCLRFDLDLAIERSAKAKARAAERRALKEAQKAEDAQKAEGAQKAGDTQTAEEARKNEEKLNEKNTQRTDKDQAPEIGPGEENSPKRHTLQSVLQVDEGNDVALADLDDDEDYKGEDDGLDDGGRCLEEGADTTCQTRGGDVDDVGTDNEQDNAQVALDELRSHRKVEVEENLMPHHPDILKRGGAEEHEGHSHEEEGEQHVETLDEGRHP